MRCLGINDNHGSSIALCDDRSVLLAVSEERLNREKNSRAFPTQALALLEQQLGLRLGDLDAIIVGSVMTPPAFLRSQRQWYIRRMQEKPSMQSALYHCYLAYASVARKLPAVKHLEQAISARVLKKELGIPAIRFIDHHHAHAISASRGCAHQEGHLVLTADGMGDGVTFAVYQAKHGRLDRLFAQSAFSELPVLYPLVTELLGFSANRHEGKVMGLAAYGKAEKTIALFSSHLHTQTFASGKGFRRTLHLPPLYLKKEFRRIFEQHSREDIAAGLQASFEQCFLDIARYWLRKTGLRHLAVAGGAFSNVKLNQRLAQLDEVDSIFVFPAMTDEGVAVGAALSGCSADISGMKRVDWGPEYRASIAKALQETSAEGFALPDLPGRVAALLAQGFIGGVCQGHMEFGPRALGCRSILARTDDKAIDHRLNQMLKRSEFMPFAPMVLEEDLNELFFDSDKMRQALAFMTICADAKPLFKEKCQAVVHVDGTARPQALTRENNPFCREVLARFKKITAIPSLLNTSFNMHEEPIVCTPQDALRTFRAAGLDFLVLENFLIAGNEQVRKELKILAR